MGLFRERGEGDADPPNENRELFTPCRSTDSAQGTVKRIFLGKKQKKKRILEKKSASRVDDWVGGVLLRN